MQSLDAIVMMDAERVQISAAVQENTTEPGGKASEDDTSTEDGSITSEDSVQTYAARDDGSNPHSPSSIVESDISRDHVPRAPLGTPQFSDHSNPIDGVSLATKLLSEGLHRLDLGPSTFAPDNTPANTGSIAGSTAVSEVGSVLAQYRPIANNTFDLPRSTRPHSRSLSAVEEISNANTRDDEVPRLLSGGLPLRTSYVEKIPTLATTSNHRKPFASTGSPSKGILRPARSSHPTGVKRAAAESLRTNDMQTVSGPEPTTPRPLGSVHVFERSIWIHEIHEDLRRALRRMRQLAHDKEAIDPSKTQQEYYEEDLFMLIDEVEEAYSSPEKLAEWERKLGM